MIGYTPALQWSPRTLLPRLRPPLLVEFHRTFRTGGTETAAYKYYLSTVLYLRYAEPRFLQTLSLYLAQRRTISISKPHAINDCLHFGNVFRDLLQDSASRPLSIASGSVPSFSLVSIYLINHLSRDLWKDSLLFQQGSFLPRVGIQGLLVTNNRVPGGFRRTWPTELISLTRSPSAHQTRASTHINASFSEEVICSILTIVSYCFRPLITFLRSS